MSLRLCVAAALTLACLTPAPAHAAEPGFVYSASPLEESKWVPGTTGAAYVLDYATTDAHGAPTHSTGMVFLPKGEPPPGGWPVVSWAHGTVGLDDRCAPSRNARSQRDGSYLATWMSQGYAVVASDYAGLGTDGLPAYLHGRSTAHNVVDMVKAARAFSGQLSRKWVTIGQSQGAGAAIYTARYATEFGGPDLDYRGAVGTGTPAYIEGLVEGIGPLVPPVPLPGALNSYLTYIFAGLRSVYPELGLDGILTPVGKQALAWAETDCLGELIPKLAGTSVGSYFTTSVASLPGFHDKITAYMAMPYSGFDKPFFMGHGLIDVDVPFATTLPYVTGLMLGAQPVTFRAYLTMHSDTMAASLPDTVPFVAGLFGSK